jgi:hypothetical protein
VHAGILRPQLPLRACQGEASADAQNKPVGHAELAFGTAIMMHVDDADAAITRAVEAGEMQRRYDVLMKRSS